MNASGSELIKVGNLGIRFLVDGPDANGSVSVFECTIPPGGRPPAPHSHDAFEETIYGLHGATTWLVDGNPSEVGPGDAICIRRGAVHSFENAGDSEAKFLAVASPGVFRPAFFREMGAVVAATGGGPPNREKVGEVMRRHGLTPAA